MMEITKTEMDAVKTVKQKWDILVGEVHQILRIAVSCIFLKK